MHFDIYTLKWIYFYEYLGVRPAQPIYKSVTLASTIPPLIQVPGEPGDDLLFHDNNIRCDSGYFKKYAVNFRVLVILRNLVCFGANKGTS